MRIVTSLTHDECSHLLDVYVNAQLSEREVAAVVAHLDHCQQCSEDLPIAQSLQRYFSPHRQAAEQQAVAELLAPAREQANFERLWARIEAPPQTAEPAPLALVEASGSRAAVQRRWGLPVSAAALLMLAVALQWSAAPPAAYHTLANAASHSACGQLRVRFSDNLAPAELQQLLHAVDASVVEGPSGHGVYTLHALQPDKALNQLRLHPAVLLAEPTSC